MLTSAVALARSGRGRVAACETARATGAATVGHVHRALSRGRMARGRLLLSACSGWRARGVQLFESHRGDSFHDSGDAAAAAARRASRARADCRHDQDRAHRLDRDGQVDRRRRCSSVPVFRSSMPTPVVRRLQGPGGALVERIGESVSRARSIGGVLDREKLAGCRPRGSASSSRARSDRPPRRSRSAREHFIAEHRRCAGARCSTFPCCSRPVARGAVRQGHRRLRSGDVQRARVLGSTRHDRRQARCDPCAANA